MSGRRRSRWRSSLWGPRLFLWTRLLLRPHLFLRPRLFLWTWLLCRPRLHLRPRLYRRRRLGLIPLLILRPLRRLRSRTFLHVRLTLPESGLITLNARQCRPQLRLGLANLRLWRRRLGLRWHNVPLRIPLLPSGLPGTSFRLNLARPVCLLRLPNVWLRHIRSSLLLRLHLLWRSRSRPAGESRPSNRYCYSRQSSRHRPIGCHRPRIDHDGGPPFVLVIELRSVLSGLALNLYLRSRRRIALPMQYLQLGRPRPRLNTTTSSIEADAVHRRPVGGSPVDHHIMRVDIANHTRVHAVHCGVVAEVVVIPVSAVVAVTCVSIAVVDASVEANMQTPESMVEAVSIAHIAPVAGCPERTSIRRSNPRSRNPVVPSIAPRPVAGSPQIVRVGCWRLLVVRQWRRRLIRFGLRQIAGIRVLSLLVVVRSTVVRSTIVRRILITLVAIIRRHARISPLDRCWRLLRIVLALLLWLVLHVLPQNLSRLALHVAAHRSHVRIRRIARVLIHLCNRRTLRRRLVAPCHHQTQSNTQAQAHQARHPPSCRTGNCCLSCTNRLLSRISVRHRQFSMCCTNTRRTHRLPIRCRSRDKACETRKKLSCD
jgi:hypothetical protein